MAAPEPGTCKSCGARIWWVTTPGGRRMPVNHERILVRAVDAPEGETGQGGRWEVIVTAEGRVIGGNRVDARFDPGRGQPLPDRVFAGGRSHFATCGKAEEHRR